MFHSHLPIKFLFFFGFLLLVSSCKVGRYFVYNFADIQDHKKFHNREVQKGQRTFKFAVGESGRYPKSITIKERDYDFESYLGNNKTVAFLIIQNDSIQFERYFRKYDQASIAPSFSMAKSVTSILIGCAIDDQLIQSVDEPITNYLPELKKRGFDAVTIEHVLQMTSGLDFNESYVNPFGDAATFYYGTNLRKSVAKMKLKNTPGSGFDYVSGNTQLLGLILERALQGKTVSDYLQEKLWIPLEMEYDASWSIDRKKMDWKKRFAVSTRAPATSQK